MAIDLDGIQARSAVNAESMYVGGLDGEGMPYIGRVFWSHALKVSLLLYSFP